MPDPLEELAQIQGLEPREAILSRALIRNKFVDAELVLDAARAAASGEGPGVLEKLTAEGHLEPDRARKIVDALEKKIAEKRAASPPPADDAAPPSEQQARGRGPKVWKPRTEQRDRSGETSVVLLGALREARLQRERAIRKLVERFVRSRQHQLVLFQLVRQREGVADSKALASSTGATPKQVRKILDEWKAKGLLKTVGSFPYYYQPRAADKENIDNFMKAWNDPARHADILKMILELERS